MLYAPEDGKLYGAQAVGQDMGIDKTIDVIATAIAGGMSVYDLTDVELCYAPPFNTAKSAVNYAGYIAENLRDGEAYFDDVAHIEGLVASGATVLDVRGKKEIEKVPLPSSAAAPNSTRRASFPEDACKARDFSLFYHFTCKKSPNDAILKAQNTGGVRDAD